jgi:hypothetical protein
MPQGSISHHNAYGKQDAIMRVRRIVRSFAPWPKRPFRNVVRYSHYASNWALYPAMQESLVENFDVAQPFKECGCVIKRAVVRWGRLGRVVVVQSHLRSRRRQSEWALYIVVNGWIEVSSSL